MEIMRKRFFIFCLLCMFLCSYSQSMDNFLRSSLDDLIRDNAFRALVGQRTGVLYHVSLPSSLFGIEAQVVRLKSGSFWTRGANFSYVDIPPGCVAMPFSKRIAIVYQILGNWSSTYYNMPGYTLVTPIVGFFAYNASDINGVVATNVQLSVSKDPISVRFQNVSLKGELNTLAKCARFDANGSIYLSEVTLPNECATRNQGHYSIVIPLMAPPPPQEPSPSPSAAELKNGRKWKVWIIACACGVVGLAVLALVGFTILRSVKRKKLVKMEKKAEEGESLGSVWVGGSRMPSAAFMRTQPTLETENVP